jgi:hypothetical protein
LGKNEMIFLEWIHGRFVEEGVNYAEQDWAWAQENGRYL